MKLLFLGDFFFDYENIPEDFQMLCRFVRNNQYQVILNLETSFGSKGKRVQKRGVHLRSSARLIEALKNLNVMAVCLANNHTMDFGSDALADLCNHLTQANILYAGAGPNRTQAIKPLKLPGTNIFLQNFAWDIEEAVYATGTNPGVAPLNRKAILEQTEKLKSQNPNSFIINIYHWGFEYNLLPMPLDIQFAHQSLESGADLIVGHHPHVIQPHEQYAGKNIFYSLGNFYFGSRRDKFNKTFKKQQPSNACDFGLGFVLDTTVLSVTDWQSVEYNKKQGISVIRPHRGGEVTRLPSIDWNTKAYCKLAKEKSANFTPILTTNPLKNYIKLKFLFFLYIVAKITQPLRKRKCADGKLGAANDA